MVLCCVVCSVHEGAVTHASHCSTGMCSRFVSKTWASTIGVFTDSRWDLARLGILAIIVAESEARSATKMGKIVPIDMAISTAKG